MIFVRQNYDPFLVNLVKALAAGGAGLGRPPWMRIKVFPGRAAELLSGGTTITFKKGAILLK